MRRTCLSLASRPCSTALYNGGIPAAPCVAGTAGDNPRLEQPADAVPMDNISSTMATATSPAPAPAPALTTRSDDAVHNPSTEVHDVPAEADDHATAPTRTTESVAKGKEKAHTLAEPSTTRERSNSALAIGPAQDDISAAPGHSDSGPVCNITLLLTSGNRHPYKIDAKYLGRRNVDIPDETDAGHPDPFSISIYTLKELILREWRSDWEAKPASPSSIRLIHFGKLLDDKEQLKKYQFSAETPNVVHMSIRPQDLDEEEPKSGSKNLPSGRGDGQRSGSNGTCCVII
ncbi:hypothetical protein E4U14_003614 [Claviceps sp. LM454 group G7]|nr:hypothetical protein E4U14_003614 [Claviceps sp. LM454 group G7]